MGVVIIKFGHLSLQIGGSSYKTKMNMDELYHFIKAEATTCEIHNTSVAGVAACVARSHCLQGAISSCSVVV
jgi:hypothetical protein